MDHWYWKCATKGVLHQISLLSSIWGAHGQEDGDWRKIWQLNVSNKVRATLWLLKRCTSMCTAKRVRRGFTAQEDCTRCRRGKEDVSHIFREWPGTVQLGREFLSSTELAKQQELDLDDWISRNIRMSVVSFMETECQLTFAIIIWSL